MGGVRVPLNKIHLTQELLEYASTRQAHHRPHGSRRNRQHRICLDVMRQISRKKYLHSIPALVKTMHFINK